MAIFSVDSSQVAQAAAMTKLQVERIRTDVATMLGQLQHLQTSWTGGAAAGFTDCVQQWQATQAQVEQSLEAISTQLSFAASTYERAEAEAASLFH